MTGVEAQIDRLLNEGQAEQAQQLAGAQYTEWLSSGRLAEGRAYLRRTLDASAAATPARASALLGAGMLALAREARDAYEQVGDRAGVATARHLTAAGTRMTGNYAGAAEIYAESLRDARERGDEVLVGAETLNLGYMKLHLGDVAGARPLFEESLRVSRGNAYVLPYSLMGMGSLALAEGEAERGTRLLAAAKAAFDAGGFAIDPGSDEEYDKGVADARAALHDRFDEVWAAGYHDQGSDLPV